MKQILKKIKAIAIKYLIGGALGALAGYLYYYYVGCRTGTCPITSNPLSSILYGTVLGLLIGSLFGRKRER